MVKPKSEAKESTSKKATTSAPSRGKVASAGLEPRDYFGFPIYAGDIVAAPVFIGGHTMYVRRRVVDVDPEGALVCTNMDGEPVNRILKPRKTFKRWENGK